MSARGKTIDTEFVSEFIQELLPLSKTTPDDICQEALDRIKKIDAQLKYRIKLNDVLSFFSYKRKNSVEENRIMYLDSLDKEISNDILNVISTSKAIDTSKLLLSLSFGCSNCKRFSRVIGEKGIYTRSCSGCYKENKMTRYHDDKRDVMLTIKQLVAADIIARNADILSLGANFSTYEEV